MTDDPENTAPAEPVQTPRKSPAPVLLTVRITKHRTKIGRMIVAKGAVKTLPAEQAQALESAGLAEITGVA